MSARSVFLVAMAGVSGAHGALAAVACRPTNIQLPKTQFSFGEPLAHPLDGNVEVYVHAGANGRIDEVRFLQSSRSRVLDRIAKETFERSFVAESCVQNAGHDFSIRAFVTVDKPQVGDQSVHVLEVSKTVPSKPDVN